MKLFTKSFILIWCLGAFSCEQHSSDSTLGMFGSTDDASYEVQEISTENSSADLQQTSNTEQREEESKRKIIKEGDMRFEAFQPTAFTQTLKGRVKAYGGYISNETTVNYGYKN